MNCSSCNSQIQPGLRWCSICHANTVNSEFGKLASPGRRLGAYVIDSVLPLFLLIFGIAGIAIGKGASLYTTGAMILWIGYAVWSLVLFFKGTTPGKRLLHMYVIREDGKPAGFFVMLIREAIGKYLSGLVLSLGYFSIVWDKDNQGWHDKLLNTYVVRK